MSDPQYTPDDVLLFDKGRRNIRHLTIQQLRDAEWNAAIEAAAACCDNLGMLTHHIDAAKAIRALKR